MKTNKSLLSVLIVLALCLALLPVSALATSGNFDPTTGGDQTYIPTATMTVYKTDDLGEPLAGAVIALMKEDGTTVYSKATTSTSGTVTFSGVVDGSYTLCEQSAPEGYIKSEKTYKIVVSNGSATLFNGRESYSYNRNPVTFVNLPDDACNVVVYKTDAEGEPLEGAVIALMVGSDLTTGGETIYAEQETDENGEALFSRLPDGSYTVVEEYAPDGYEKTDETFRLDVFEGEATLTINGVDGISPEDHPMVFVNGFADNSMDVAVTDGLGNPVPGAKVTITDEDGKDEETTTDRRGHAHFLNLPDGKYTIRVPEVPSPLVPPEREAAIIVDNGVIRLDDGAYAPPLVFVSYKEVALNKTDHFAFLKGYPDGTFRPEPQHGPAPRSRMFARLITERWTPTRPIRAPSPMCPPMRGMPAMLASCSSSASSGATATAPSSPTPRSRARNLPPSPAASTRSRPARRPSATCPPTTGRPSISASPPTRAGSRAIQTARSIPRPT